MYHKQNQSGYRDALLREAEGLTLLRHCIAQQAENPLRIPDVARVSENTLSMTAIKAVSPSSHQWQQLGVGLALLHQQLQPYYGLETDNYIGLNPQPNGISKDWGTFFVEQRLGHQISLIADNALKQNYQQRLKKAREPLRGFLNHYCQHPSLLHGDLWSGNVLFSSDGVWLIDPAAYCGDREADLAMTELFGGFDREFYRAYDATYPRTEAYSTKREIYNLYHRLNHYNLFGRSYLSGCEQSWAMIKTL
ncbi:fructosamine kinase family protein [bacterium SCSIO 12696]|nr:fructosamine kinase family protein [bacterium SCSIO 12696]